MSTPVPNKSELAVTAASLAKSKDAIIQKWKKQIQEELPAARGKTKSALEDHLPQLVTEMVDTIRSGVHCGSTERQDELSKEHARQRAVLDGYTLEEVLEEYRIAREIIISEMNRQAPMSQLSQCLVNRIIDRSIVEAATEFSRFKNAESAEARLFAEVAQNKAEDAQTRAEIANQAKSDFLANISHEIRTPLGAVLGFTELMRDPTLSSSDRIKFAGVVNRNGRQLSTLINDILDIAKIEAGQLLVEKVPMSLASVVAEVTTLLRATAESKGVKLNVLPWTDIPKAVSCDPTRLMQILTNMIGNAIKFTTTGEVKVALHRNSDRDTPDMYSFVVTDTGVGISLEQQARLFKSFSQADSSTARRFGGTGLGLFLSKQLTHALGGDLILRQSVVNQGSTFVATFLAEALIEEIPSIQIEAGSQLPHLKNVRILLAEDSPDNQALVTRYLGVEGALIDIANNGQEAVEMALSKEYDVVLLDIQMPVLDGYEATRRLRATGYIKPIIALTANAMTAERKKAFDVGCNAHLTKPINRTELIHTVQKFAFGPPH